MKKHGIKETTEALKAINEVSLFLIDIFKDGVDLGDFPKIWEKITKDEDFKKTVAEAFEGYSKIPAELSDVDIEEGVELATMQLRYLPAIVKAIKGERHGA